MIIELSGNTYYTSAARVAVITILSISSFLSCQIEKNIVQEIVSPSGSFKIVEQSVDGGVATDSLVKLFIMRSDFKLKRSYNPELITIKDNITEITWKDNYNILIRVKSESDIKYLAVKIYEFRIEVIAESP